jgi:hypothetical protein
MGLYNKCDVKNDFAYVLQFSSLISDGQGGVTYLRPLLIYDLGLLLLLFGGLWNF